VTLVPRGDFHEKLNGILLCRAIRGRGLPTYYKVPNAEYRDRSRLTAYYRQWLEGHLLHPPSTLYVDDGTKRVWETTVLVTVGQMRAIDKALSTDLLV